MDTILKFLKENLPPSTFIGLIFGFIIILLIYITFQVTNHIPTQIHELKQNINELKQNINENRKLIIENQKETNYRFDKLYELLLKRK